MARQLRSVFADVAATHASYRAAALAVASPEAMSASGGRFEPTLRRDGRGTGRHGRAYHATGTLEPYGRPWTAANQMTLLRLLLVPVFVLFMIVRDARVGAADVQWSPARLTA